MNITDTIPGALQDEVTDWRSDARQEVELYGAEIRRRHACPYCRRVAAYADISEFENDADYWLQCRACAIEWSISEEANEVLARLGLTTRAQCAGPYR
jgi:hypothetical protein